MIGVVMTSSNAFALRERHHFTGNGFCQNEYRYECLDASNRNPERETGFACQGYPRIHLGASTMQRHTKWVKFQGVPDQNTRNMPAYLGCDTIALWGERNWHLKAAWAWL